MINPLTCTECGSNNTKRWDSDFVNDRQKDSYGCEDCGASYRVEYKAVDKRTIHD